MFITALFWFALCVCLACIEIESEGKWGWAEKAPTWYRTTGTVARLYGAFMGGKPLTGYHAFMFFFPLIVVHVPFVSGVPWSAGAELRALALYFAIGVLWDFLWFVLNPAYGIRNFRKQNVWWHAKSPWVFGRFPLDYAVGIAVSLGCAYAGSCIGGRSFVEHAAVVAWMLTLTAIAIAASPIYHRWYAGMRLRDDRDKTDIFHSSS